MSDGGQAFPIPGMTFPNDNIQYPEPGMSLRDYFAAHAPAMTEQWFSDSGGKAHWLEAEASWRFAYADAMIAERAKPRQA